MNKIDNNSEQHRRECEARHVLKQSDDQRQEYYKGVQSKRGQKGIDDLLNEVKKQMRLENSKDLSI